MSPFLAAVLGVLSHLDRDLRLPLLLGPQLRCLVL